jgi:hypothetical protein
MNIALPILLLVFGSLTFWLLAESSLKWYIKTVCISMFCFFTIIFWSTIHSFLGWPAGEDDVPEVVRIHWVIIKEPNKHTEYPGAIYLLINSAQLDDGFSISKFFGYKKDSGEPRLFGVPYDRALHEHLSKNVISKLKKGQTVLGKLSKKAGKSRKGDNNKEKSKGGGSESQEQRWHFHELLPSDFLQKPTD